MYGYWCWHTGWDHQGKQTMQYTWKEVKNRALYAGVWVSQGRASDTELLRMFIEERTWETHLQKGCGGSRGSQRERFSYSAAPTRVSPGGMICCPIYGQSNQAFMLCLHQLIIGYVSWEHRGPYVSALFVAEGTPGWAESSPLSVAVRVASPSYRGTRAAGPHVHRTEKCRNVRAEQRRKSLKVQTLWRASREQVEKTINSLCCIRSAGGQRKKEGVGNSVKCY